MYIDTETGTCFAEKQGTDIFTEKMYLDTY